MRVIIVALCCFLLSSCVTTGQSSPMMSQPSQSWQGKSVKALVAKYGTPALENINANGNKTYSYVTKSVKTYTPPNNSQIATVALPHGRAVSVTTPQNPNAPGSTIVECVTTFEANKSGIIIGMKKQGAGC